MHTTLASAKPVPIAYRDGRTETLLLGELSIRQLYTFIKHLGGSDTPALVALCAGKPVEWVDTLTDASFDALVAESIRLNFQRATDRVKSDPVALSRLGPMLVEIDRVKKAIGADPFKALPEEEKKNEEKETSGAPGTISSPAPAASASAVEIGNGS